MLFYLDVKISITEEFFPTISVNIFLICGLPLIEVFNCTSFSGYSIVLKNNYNSKMVEQLLKLVAVEDVHISINQTNLGEDAMHPRIVQLTIIKYVWEGKTLRNLLKSYLTYR